MLELQERCFVGCGQRYGVSIRGCSSCGVCRGVDDHRRLHAWWEVLADDDEVSDVNENLPYLEDRVCKLDCQDQQDSFSIRPKELHAGFLLYLRNNLIYVGYIWCTKKHLD